MSDVNALWFGIGVCVGVAGMLIAGLVKGDE